MTSQHRLYGADFMRASACFLVLFHHLSQRVNFSSALGNNVLLRVFSNVGGLGVGVFFVLSGFLLARPFWLALDAGAPMPSLRTYALRRAARILPAFWLALTAGFVLSFTVFGFKLDAWLWLRYLAGFFLVSDWHWTTLFPVEINDPLWSIGFEISSYAMLPLGFLALFGLAQGRVRAWPARLLWLLVIGAAIAGHLAFINLVHVDPVEQGWEYGLQGGARIWMPWFNPFSFFAMFATGALGAGVGVLLSRGWLNDILAGAAFIAIGAIIWTDGLKGGDYYGWLRVPHEFPVFQMLLAAALATAPSSMLIGRLLDNRLVSWLARISFGIYIWHYVVLNLVHRYWVPEFEHNGVSDPVRFFAASAVIIAITMVIASLSYRWLEEPIIRWARHFEHRDPRGVSVPA